MILKVMLAYLEAAVRPEWIARWLQKNPKSPKKYIFGKIEGVGDMFETLATRNHEILSNVVKFVSKIIKKTKNCPCGAGRQALP